MTADVPLAMRRAIFAELVAAQDEGVPVRDSRALVANKHKLDIATVRAIEQDGLDGEWPPLSPA
jgi:hypothetical protein